MKVKNLEKVMKVEPGKVFQKVEKMMSEDF